MRLWFSQRVLKNPVYLAYTIFQVLPKKQNIANYRRFYASMIMGNIIGNCL